MLQQILRAVIVAVVLYAVYFILGLIVSAIGLPAVTMTIIAVLLLLAYCIYLLKLFGITI